MAVAAAKSPDVAPPSSNKDLSRATSLKQVFSSLGKQLSAMLKEPVVPKDTERAAVNAKEVMAEAGV